MISPPAIALRLRRNFQKKVFQVEGVSASGSSSGLSSVAMADINT